MNKEETTASDSVPVSIDTGASGNGRFAKNDRVVITSDGDGGLGVSGHIEKVFLSGRCLVYLDNGDIRNFLPGHLTHEIPD